MMSIFYIVGIGMLILWVCLPFAIFGIKDRLDKIITELRKLNLTSQK